MSEKKRQPKAEQPVLMAFHEEPVVATARGAVAQKPAQPAPLARVEVEMVTPSPAPQVVAPSRPVDFVLSGASREVAGKTAFHWELSDGDGAAVGSGRSFEGSPTMALIEASAEVMTLLQVRNAASPVIRCSSPHLIGFLSVSLLDMKRAIDRRTAGEKDSFYASVAKGEIEGRVLALADLMANIKPVFRLG